MFNFKLDFKKALHKAIDLSDSEKYDKALKLFDEIVAAYPNESQARFERGMVLLNLDRDAEARTEFEAVLDLEPDYPGVRKWLAGVLSGQGDNLAAAEMQLQELLAESIKTDAWAIKPYSWVQCADYFLKAGATARARETLDLYFSRFEERVEAYDGDITGPWRTYASILLQLGEVQEALIYAEDAARHPKRVPADESFLEECNARLNQLAKIGRETAPGAE